METKLSGRVAVVTGAGSGIGAAIATRLAAEGASVAINYREDPAPAEALAASLNGQGFQTGAFRADVSRAKECGALMEAVVARFGHLDILVSNAGVENFTRLEDITEDDFERVFAVNVGGQLFATQAAARHIPDGGRVVLTSSASAHAGVFYHTLYAASKAAISALALNLSLELGERGITINAIAPGGTATRMARESGRHYAHPALKDVPPEQLFKSKTALQRVAQPAEIAAAVAFLVSDDASYITGSTLAVDGGRL